MAFEELKARQATMWGSGPYQGVTETLTDIHEQILATLSPATGTRWLDLACGTGAVAERAAEAGAEVTGVDLAPDLVEAARKRAADRGLAIDYRVGDCERLDLPDASYERVSSSVGVMFAPDHAATARELARVTAPGGRIALVNWTPEGGLGRMFRMMGPFMAPPPPGVGSPFDWGRPEHVEELLGDAFALEITEHTSTLRLPSGAAYWELFSREYGPTVTAAGALDAERRAEFQRTWVEFFESEYAGPDGDVVHPREYLLVVGTRR